MRNDQFHFIQYALNQKERGDKLCPVPLLKFNNTTKRRGVESVRFLSKIATVILTVVLLTACGSSYQSNSLQNEVTSELNAINYVSFNRMEELLSRAHDLEDVVYIYIHADYPIYTDLNDLASRAEDIVKVEVLDERVGLINVLLPSPYDTEIQEMYEIHTIHRLRVLEVFKGDTEIGEIIEVRQSGGQYGNINLIHPYRIPLVSGDEVIVFLANPGLRFGIQKPSLLLNPFQSVYRLAPLNEDSRLRSESEELESVADTRFNLTLTLDDLARITEAAQDQ